MSKSITIDEIGAIKFDGEWNLSELVDLANQFHAFVHGKAKKVLSEIVVTNDKRQEEPADNSEVET